MKTVIVEGVRTPFSKAGTDLKELSAIELGKRAVQGLLDRTEIPVDEIDQLVYGTVVHDPYAGNIAREVGLAVLPKDIPAHTVSRACTSSNQAIVDAAMLVETGQADVVVAGGAESLSRVPLMVADPLAQALIQASRAKSMKQRLVAFSEVRPKHILPANPDIAEPTTGETMGEATERMAKENGISREKQDRWALRSHELAHAGTEDGRITSEIVPVYPPPDFDDVVETDNGIRSDSSLEALAKLRPAFDREHGTLTAGNSSPLTDGASAVLIMSEEKADALGYTPLAWIKSWAFTALDPGGQLLQGPAYAAPLALDRARISMKEIELMEMHEAFAAQVLSNLHALSSKRFAEEELGRSKAVGHPDEDVINVMGGSIAIGHPFAATGARVTTTLANEMSRRDSEFGLVTVCAAGGMGFGMVLERR